MSEDTPTVSTKETRDVLASISETIDTASVLGIQARVDRIMESAANQINGECGCPTMDVGDGTDPDSSEPIRTVMIYPTSPDAAFQEEGLVTMIPGFVVDEGREIQEGQQIGGELECDLWYISRDTLGNVLDVAIGTDNISPYSSCGNCRSRMEGPIQNIFKNELLRTIRRVQTLKRHPNHRFRWVDPDTSDLESVWGSFKWWFIHVLASPLACITCRDRMIYTPEMVSPHLFSEEEREQVRRGMNREPYVKQIQGCLKLVENYVTAPQTLRSDLHEALKVQMVESPFL